MLGFEQFLGIMSPRPFAVQLRCYSMLYFPRADAAKINAMDYGGNILLPNSALDTLTRLNVQYPLLFKISGLSVEHQRVTHAGVLEFLAEEGKCYLPSWMMRQLKFVEGELASIEYKSLPMATYAKLKPASADFLNISNPRAILEVELRKFRCLTKNDVISMAYDDQILGFKVMDLKPQNAVSITECDVNLEFDVPDGYVEPNHPVRTITNKMPDAPPAVISKLSSGAAFSGEGMRLDGKVIKSRTVSTSSITESFQLPSSVIQHDEKPGTSSAASANRLDEELLIGDIIVDENYIPGQLKFIRFNYKNRVTLCRQLKESQIAKNDRSKCSVPFAGTGLTIRANK